MQVTLYSDVNKGKTTKTVMGPVTFDAAGYSTFEVKDGDEDTLTRFRAVGWLVEAPKPATVPEPKASKNGLHDDLPPEVAQQLPVVKDQAKRKRKK